MSAGAIPVPWGGVAPAAGGAAASGGCAEIAAAALGRAAGVVGLIFYPSPLGDGTIIHGPEDIATTPTVTQTQTIPQSQTRAKPRAQTRTCEPSNNKDCRQPPQTHSGRIQAQEGTITYIPAAASGSAWTNLPQPPNLAMCTGFAYNCRKALTSLQGADRGKSFQNGADVAYQNLINWMKNVSPNGVGALYKKSFYFNGMPEKEGKKAKGKDSRRVDFDVLKGEALKG